MNDLDDREFEYDRLATSLDRRAILAFAQQCSIRNMCSMDNLKHLSAVGELAARYADSLEDDIDLMEQRYRRQVCEAAGYLHEAMLQGCRFEDIIRLADEAVARTVSSITPDIRSPAPVRTCDAANRVGNGDVMAQIVKLADLRHECGRKEAMAETEPGKVREWLHEAVVIVGSFHKLTHTPLAARVGALKRALEALDVKTRAHRRRTAV